MLKIQKQKDLYREKIIIIFLLQVLFVAFSFGQTRIGSKRSTYLRKPNLNLETLHGMVRNDLEFIELNKKQVVADIGSYDGYYPLRYSLFTDSITFYLNDITKEGFKDFDSIHYHCIKLKGNPIASEFNIQYGTDSSTNLPAQFFDKIILRDALHHFKFRDKMLHDIRSKLKQGGEILLYEPIRDLADNAGNLCNGAMYMTELLVLMHQYNFELKRELDLKHNNGLFWFSFGVRK